MTSSAHSFTDASSSTNGSTHVICSRDSLATPPDVPALDSFRFLAPMSFLFLFNLVVIVGNSLVIVAVFTQDKLRTVTNTFVVSLALADLLLGITVLPFSSAKEVLRYWPFGATWCSVWLAVDVWLCTASILNLCAISFDRFLAIGYSFKYPLWMTPRRARLLVAGVWTLAFVICFPPLIGWKEQRWSSSSGGVATGETVASQSRGGGSEPRVVSGVVSHEGGVLNDSNRQDLVEYSWGNTAEDLQHLGRPPMRVDGCAEGFPICIPTPNSGYIIYSACGSFWIPMCVMVFFYWRVYVTARRACQSIRRGVIVRSVEGSSGDPGSPSTATSGSGRAGAVTVALRVHRGGMTSVVSTPVLKVLNEAARRSIGGTEGPLYGSNSGGDGSPRTRIKELGRITNHRDEGQSASQRFASPSYRAFARDNSSDEATQGRNYFSRLSKERKAAKTIGIIVGCFIACWAPFFTVYLLGAFCVSCTQNMVFTVFFWLGYGNSALNPFIYALYSRDFRFAFQRILGCRTLRRRSAATDGFLAGDREGGARADRMLMMARLHGQTARPPDGRKNVSVSATDTGGGMNMPSSVYRLRR